MRTFSIGEIYNLYNNHCNLSYNYFIKYENLNEIINLPDWEMVTSGYRPNSVEISRLFCILDFKEWIKKYNINPVNKLLVTGHDPEQVFLQSNYIFVADYDQNKAYDLHTIDLPEKDFDFFLFSQTLEHLYNPVLAMDRIATHIKSGGYIFTSVPTINVPHMTPIHFQHFQPMGLVMLFVGSGFEILEMGQFGSSLYTDFLFNKGWPIYKDLMDEKGFVINDQNKPCQCWCLARKL